MKRKSPQCALCGVGRCRSHDENTALPANCPTKNYADILQSNTDINKTDPDICAINNAWITVAKQVVKDTFKWTRLEEIMEFARVLGYKKLGIATCYGLLWESKLLTKVLQEHGFEVVSVSCLAGEVEPEAVDLAQAKIFCNSLLQAEILNREGTQLNIVVGLCVGHDIIFNRHSKAYATTLVVKDYSLNHNPVAALYQSAGAFNYRFKVNQEHPAYPPHKSQK